MSKRSLFFLIVVLLVVFQNCSNIDFSALQPGGTPLSSSNNGTGYSGKPDEDFYRFHPEFTCESKPAPVSHIHSGLTGVTLTENKQLQCGAIKQALDPNAIDRSVFQNDVVGLLEGIFESETSTPQSIPANLVEVWCRTSKDLSGIETITYFDRVASRAESEIYSSGPNGTLRQTLPVSRVLSAQRVSIRGAQDFALEVYRDRPALELGLFQADLEVSIEGQKLKMPTSCRLGGSLDPLIWPARQIVDNSIQLLKMSTDLSFFGYTATLGAAPASRLFSSLVTGAQHQAVTGPMLSTGVKNFEVSPSLDGFVFWGDPRYRGGPELFKVGRGGEALTQLNETLTNTQQGQASEIQFSPDGKQVYYRDGQQETGEEGGADIEMWLRSVSLVGGPPVVVSAPLPLVGDHGVHHFAVSKSKQKIAYLAGQSSVELFIADLDGRNLIKPLASRFHWYEQIRVPDPGDYLFITSVPVNIKGRLHFTTNAVAFDGSNSHPLPQDWELSSVSPLGNTALIFERSAPVVVNGESYLKTKLMDLRTGAFVDLPLVAKPSFTKDASFIIGQQLNERGEAIPWMYSLNDKTENSFCPSLAGTITYIKESSFKNEFVITSYSRLDRILRVYSARSIGDCSPKNSLPLEEGTVSDIQISGDKTAALVKVTRSVSGKPHDQMYLVPLNGKPAIAVNTPVYAGAKVTSAWFLKDARSVLFVGDQVTPSEQRVFLWKAP